MNMFIFLIIIMILLFMLLVNMLISKKMMKNREKNSPFECGFDPQSNNRMPFSLQFFLLSILFLIFDVEIAMMLPMILSFNNFNIYYLLMNMIIIIIILLIGLYIEWMEGALKWFKNK